MENTTRNNTKLDKQLQEMACQNWTGFVKLIGENNVMAAKICILREKGQSYNQIALKLRTTFSVARTKSSKCECNLPNQQAQS